MKMSEVESNSNREDKSVIELGTKVKSDDKNNLTYDQKSNSKPPNNPANNLNNQIKKVVQHNNQINSTRNEFNGKKHYKNESNSNYGTHSYQNNYYRDDYSYNINDGKEKKFTGRCRLFVGNLPTEINENEFKELFIKYGEIGESFLNTQRGFGFIKLDTRINAEHAKQELDGYLFRGRALRVRFATHGAAVRVRNLSPFVSNEYLEECFSMFGTVERAIVIVDEKGRPTGEGIVEFERKPAAANCIAKCSDACFILTNYPKPVIVEPLEQKDDEDGLPEKALLKNPQFYTERETPARFAQQGSFEYNLAMKWKDLYEQEKQFNEEVKKRIEQSKEQLEFEIEQSMIEHKTQMLKEDLKRRQEELQRMEELRQSEFQRRQEMELRRQQEERMKREENYNNNSYRENGDFKQNFNERRNQNYVSPRNEHYSDNRYENNSKAYHGYYQQTSNNQTSQVTYDHNNKSLNNSNVMTQFSSPYMLAAAAAAAATAAAAAGYTNIPAMNSNSNYTYNNSNSNNNYSNDRRRPYNNNNNNRGPSNHDGYTGYDKKRARF